MVGCRGADLPASTGLSRSSSGFLLDVRSAIPDRIADVADFSGLPWQLVADRAGSVAAGIGSVAYECRLAGRIGGGLLSNVGLCGYPSSSGDARLAHGDYCALDGSACGAN